VRNLRIMTVLYIGLIFLRVFRVRLVGVVPDKEPLSGCYRQTQRYNACCMTLNLLAIQNILTANISKTVSRSVIMSKVA